MTKDLRIIIKGNDLTESVLGWTMQVTTKELSCGGVQWKEPIGSVYSIQFTDGTVEMLDGKHIEFKEAEEQNPKSNKYAELFSAKLNNMNLVLLHKHKDWESWAEDEAANREVNPHFMISDNFDYFLCLSKFKFECLGWLNGAELKARPTNIPHWNCYFDNMPKHTWQIDSPFMIEDMEIIPKPSKEEIRITNGNLLFRASIVSFKSNFPDMHPAEWNELSESMVQYWCDIAESIQFKEKVSE